MKENKHIVKTFSSIDESRNITSSRKKTAHKMCVNILNIQQEKLNNLNNKGICSYEIILYLKSEGIIIIVVKPEDRVIPVRRSEIREEPITSFKNLE